MSDNEIKAVLAEVWAGWLMDSSDEHCQSAAMRHLVDAVEAAERERCAKLCEALAESTATEDEADYSDGATECTRRIRGD